jgi:hypothetical protein
MIRMFELDIPSISAIVAAVGVLVGVILTVLELRHLWKQRQTDLVVRLYSVFTTGEFLEAILKVRNLEFKDYRDFVKKYGSVLSETPTNVAILKIANYFEQAGTLLYRGLIDADMASGLLMPATIDYWNKLKPLIEGFREETGSRYFSWFEYFYNEMKKREQKFQQSKV